MKLVMQKWSHSICHNNHNTYMHIVKPYFVWCFCVVMVWVHTHFVFVIVGGNKRRHQLRRKIAVEKKALEVAINDHNVTVGEAEKLPPPNELLTVDNYSWPWECKYFLWNALNTNCLMHTSWCTSGIWCKKRYWAICKKKKAVICKWMWSNPFAKQWGSISSCQGLFIYCSSTAWTISSVPIFL